MKVCFLCTCGDNLIEFSEENFEKCRRMKVFREKKNFKYHDIEFPKTKNDAAYHLECYRKFVVLKGKYKDEYEKMFQHEHVSKTATLYVLFSINNYLLRRTIFFFSHYFHLFNYYRCMKT